MLGVEEITGTNLDITEKIHEFILDEAGKSITCDDISEDISDKEFFAEYEQKIANYMKEKGVYNWAIGKDIHFDCGDFYITSFSDDIAPVDVKRPNN